MQSFMRHILLIVLLLSGVVPVQATQNWSIAPAKLTAPLVAQSVAQPPAEQYLFVELWVRVTGTGNLPLLCIDFPGYEFEPDTGELTPFFEEELPDLVPSDWGFVGRGSSRGGAAGCGAASGLTAVPSLPYTTTLGLATGRTDDWQEELRAVPVVLQAIAADGMLTATIDGTEVMLAPGEHWSTSAVADLVNEEFQGQYQVTSSVTNYGWQSRMAVEGAEQVIWLPLLMQ